MPSSKPSRMSCWLIFLNSVLSLCLICSTLLSAQGTGGRILGRVPIERRRAGGSEDHAHK